MKNRCLWKAKSEETFLYTLLHCDTRKEDFWSRETRNNNRILILRQNPIYSISPSALSWSKCANKSTISYWEHYSDTYRDRAGSETLHKEGVISQIARLMKVEKDPTIRLSIIRCIGELSKKNEERAKEVLKQCGVPFFMDILSTHDMKTVNASSYIIQV